MEIRVWKSEMEMLSGQCFLKPIFKMLNTYMYRSLIYRVGGHSINWQSQKCDRCEGGDKQGVIGNTIKAKYT